MQLAQSISHHRVPTFSAAILLLTLHGAVGARVRIHRGALIADASGRNSSAPALSHASAPALASVMPKPGSAEKLSTSAAGVAKLSDKAMQHIDGETYADDWLHERGSWATKTAKPNATEKRTLQKAQDQRWKEFLDKRKALEKKLTASRKQPVAAVKVPEQGFAGKTVQHIDGASETDDWQNEYGTRAKVARTTTTPTSSTWLPMVVEALQHSNAAANRIGEAAADPIVLWSEELGTQHHSKL